MLEEVLKTKQGPQTSSPASLPVRAGSNAALTSPVPAVCAAASGVVLPALPTAISTRLKQVLKQKHMERPTRRTGGPNNRPTKRGRNGEKMAVIVISEVLEIDVMEYLKEACTVASGINIDWVVKSFSPPKVTLNKYMIYMNKDTYR